jgi:hypothetical protein
MSPTVRHNLAAFELDAVSPARLPTRARLYAIAVLVAALALVAALWIGGAALPEPGLLLVLALPLALCMNRYLFFPNEVGVTADAAVIFAAMVAFRGSAQWLGPLLLALLAGPLDARHWGARAFTRMAYNSGSTALVAAAGLAVCVPLAHELGDGWEATVTAATVASVPYFVAESLLGVTLVSLLGERPRDAVRHQLPLNTIVFPLAAAGAAAGFVALATGWWLVLLVLLPCPLAPELVFVVVSRRWTRARVGVAVAAGLLLTAAIVPTPTAAAVGLVAFAVLAGVESRAGRMRMPVLAVVVAPTALVVLSGAVQLVAIVLVLVAASATSAWMTDVTQPDYDWARLVWCVPVLTAALTCAECWRAVGAPGAPLFFAVGFGVLVVGATWGSPPWRSRFLGTWSDEHLGSRRRVLLVALAVASVTSMLVAVAVPAVETGALLAAALCTEAALAAASIAVRQWRFAPRRRTVEGLIITAAAIAAATAAASIGPLPGAAVVFAIAVALIVALVVALPLDRALAKR